jgi:hypothetical protein
MKQENQQGTPDALLPGQETTALVQFIHLFQSSFSSNIFQKCTLSRPGNNCPPELKNIYLRPVSIKNVDKIACTFRYKTRDEVKNYSLAECVAALEQWLGTHFLNADLFSTNSDATFSIDQKGQARIQLKKPLQVAPVVTDHNRQKQRLLDPALPWLHTLGITSLKGEVLANAQDKWRQINKYLEIIEGLVKDNALPQEAVVADMGSGKGYLTFALYQCLRTRLSMQPQVIGIELRTNLVTLCNEVSAKAGYTGLSFVAQDIQAFSAPRLDMLIALHACDTATDLAIAKGIQANAAVIVVAPCCHKQIRKEMTAVNELAPLLKHGILEERQAEILTDGIRALLLEANGYKTQVFEFISTEHTAKNVMITAVKVKEGHKTVLEKNKLLALERIDALKKGFGIRQHYLEYLLQTAS